MIERIAILGTGLLGTSAGLALRAAGFRGSITGWNRGAEQAQTALAMGAIDTIATDPLQAARESQVTLLCVPIYATLDLMEKLSGVLGPEHLVTDVGSTKAQITETAARLFNARSARRFCRDTPWRAKNAAARRWRMQSCFVAQCGCLRTFRRGNAHKLPRHLCVAGGNGSSRWGPRPLTLTPRAMMNSSPG